MGNVIIGLIVFALAVVLQVYLSQKEDKRLGLILPVLGLVFAAIRIFTISVTASTTVGQVLGSGLSTFLLSSVPAIVLITIYIWFRGKIKQNEELENINL